MKRAIVLSLVFVVGVCQAQDEWSYPVDPYFGVLHASEYPDDAFPIDVNFMPKTIATGTALRMGDPAASWTYWPEPSYYWWDALTGPGILHGAWQSTAITKDVRECPPEVCVQIYDPNDAGGNIEFIFDSQTENVRIRLARFGSVDEGGFKVGSDWGDGQVEIPKDAFMLEHGEESTSCAAYEEIGDEYLEYCRVYQVVIPPVPDSSVLLYGKCYKGDCSVLKVSSTTDSVSYYPGSEATATDDPSDDSEAGSDTVNSSPAVIIKLSDKSATENQSTSFSVAGNFEDSDGDSLAFSATGLPASIGIEATTGMISGTPAANDANKSFAVTITATDPSGASAIGSFKISVSAAPKPVPEPQSTPVQSSGGGSFGPLALTLMIFFSLMRTRRRTEL